jgi:hypothetical protein
MDKLKMSGCWSCNAHQGTREEVVVVAEVVEEERGSPEDKEGGIHREGKKRSLEEGMEDHTFQGKGE